jgi:hypothetical protein
VRIKPIGVAEADGSGTTAYSTDGIVLYTPTQAETNYSSFILIAKKTGCIPASITVITSASTTTGYAGVDWSKVTSPTTTLNLSGTTIKTATDVAAKTDNLPTDPADQSLIIAATDAVMARLGAPSGASIAADIATRLPTASYTTPPTAGAIADAVWDEARTGHTTAGTFGYYLDAQVSTAGGGLTAGQETTLNEIHTYTAQISGSRIAHTGPVTSGGNLELIKGKDYTVTSGNEIALAITDTGGALYADFISGTLAASKAFGARRDNGDATIAGTIYSVSYASNVTTFTIEVAAAQLTDSLTEGDDWEYMIQRTTSGGKNVVGVSGQLTLLARVV